MMNNRNKAWRQAKHEGKKLKQDGYITKPSTAEKNWKLMYTRSEKLKRAKQLGFDYPSITLRQKLDSEIPINT